MRESAISRDQADNEDYNDGTADGDQGAVDESTRGIQTEMARDEPAHERATDAKQDVNKESIARALHDLASDPARDQAGNNPQNDSHHNLLCVSSLAAPLRECSVLREGAGASKVDTGLPLYHGSLPFDHAKEFDSAKAVVGFS
jgi:hypothetical protein